MATGGSIESITLAGREFAVAADAESTRDLGGYTNEAMPNGNGTVRQKKTRKSWNLTVGGVEVDDTRGDHEFLQGLANRASPFPVTATYVSGVTYQGTGFIVGDLAANSTNTSVDLVLSGGGQLTQQ